MPSVVKPAVALLALVVVMRRFKPKPIALLSDLSTAWFFAFALFAWAGLIHSTYPERVSPKAFDIVKDFVVYLIIVNLLANRQGMERAIWLLVIVGGTLGCLSFYQEATGTFDNNYGGLAQMKTAFIANGVENRARAAGPIQDPNGYAQLLVPLLPLALWALANGRTWVGKLLGGVAVAGITSGIVLTFSRGGYLALMAALILFAVFMRISARYVALLLVLLALTFSFAPVEFRARFGTLSELLPTGQVTDTSLQGRSAYLRVALAMFADNPIVGVGLDNYRMHYPAYIRELGGGLVDVERAAHSLYLQVMAEHGLIGMVIFGGLLMVTWQRLSRAQVLFRELGEQRFSELAGAAKAGFGGFLVSSIFFHDAYIVFLWLQVSLAVALYLIARQTVEAMEPGSAQARRLGPLIGRKATAQ
jgi:O-antigen ligase